MKTWKFYGERSQQKNESNDWLDSDLIPIWFWFDSDSEFCS